jgi:dCMP deaminase
MDSRLDKKDYYLAMLKLVASRSTCARRAVGAIITDKEGHILSTGYNGVPKGFDHCIDTPCSGAKDEAGNTSFCMAVHAEQNALLQCLDLSKAHTIYCSCAPCFVCAKMIANTSIESIICESSYADERGLAILLERGCSIEIEGRVIKLV